MTDPVTLEVVRHAAAAVCEEMNAALVQSAYSPNITERRDCSSALFDAQGDLVAQAESLPVHLGAMPFSVDAALEAVPPASLEPGDAILLNDPYHGGAHLPDLTLVSPVFPPAGDAPIAYVANRAHHADVGGSRAGSVAADTRAIYEEGIRLPPTKLTESVRALLLANTRTPDERRGDLRAQEAANDVGCRRARELLERYGRASLADHLSAIQDYAERRMRSAIEDLPTGTASFEDVIESDGAGASDLPVRVTVTIEDRAVTVDFAGTAPQTPGPVNAVYAVTASATYYALRCVTDPSIPPSAGCYRPIEIETPSESIVDPEPPAAVVAGNLETSQRITDVVLGAIAELAPEQSVAAGQGTMNNLTVGGRDEREETPDSPFTFYETQAGGFGAHAAGDGMDGVHVHMSNTLNTPIEVLETTYPMRVHEYALRADSGGAGEYRGGLGLRRDIEIRSPASVSIVAERHVTGPYGLAGGDAGATGAALLFDSPAAARADKAPERLPSKVDLTVSAGTVVSLRTPGGGGFGDPADRSTTALAADYRAGLVTDPELEAAYGHAPTDLEDG